MEKLKPMMFVGTGSDVGKSVLCTALCRIFRQDGYCPAPFKSQNMALNSYSTLTGGEIGRAQAVQAEACGIVPETDMNPVLLKPTEESVSQVVVDGQPVGNMSAREYFRRGNKQDLWGKALAAYQRLSGRYNPIVLEGAGSISELNLRDRDITNMRMAEAVGASTYLVADIERGGVFASVYGSVMLLPDTKRKLLYGIIINKFRGDVSLFDEGRRMLEDLTGVPVVGVVPVLRDVHIPAEDSMALEHVDTRPEVGKVNVAVIRLPHVSNFTDFDALVFDGRFHVYYTDEPAGLSGADVIILPGTKNTIADLEHIRRNGVVDAVVEAYGKGKLVVGICGGYQMLGLRVEDPLHVEGRQEVAEGIGLLPLVTVLGTKKMVCQSEFRFRDVEGEACQGYQIHMGETSVAAGDARATGLQPLNTLSDGSREGYWLDERCWGSYMHGILDNPVVLDALAGGIRRPEGQPGYVAFKEQQYDLLAERVRQVLDMDYIYRTLKG